ncbi:MAG: ATPase [Hyphomicrobium sp. 32-62-53]|nr:MAG: ATPase [Hyphomicrobium sp. 12-62-95]OYY01754.1 MAG: ATPase [Hyphomicrobium sp. 32-62-53]
MTHEATKITVIDFNDVEPARLQRPAHYDIDLIVRRLRETAEIWVPRLFPNGRRHGDEWRLANIRGDAPRKNGSCVISLKGPHAGDWHEFDGEQGGGPISAIQQATDLDGAALIRAAAEIAGVVQGAPQRRAPAASAVPPPSKRDAASEIAHILSGAAPIAGTAADRYLAGRGVVLPTGADLQFHSDLTHWETKSGFPAMLGLVRDSAGDVIGLHRTYLGENPDGSIAKAPVAKPRMMLGKMAGGAVRLAAFNGHGALGLCEGIETGLAVMTACPGFAVWATLSTSGLEQVQLPPDAKRVMILADHDASGAGLRAAETAARRLRSEGREVVIALPPQPGQDFNDLLRAAGPDAVAAAITAALPKTEDAAPEIGQHRPMNFLREGKDTTVLRADEGDLARAVEKTWSLLLASNRTPWLFRYAGIPTWVVPDDEGRPVAATLNEDRLRHMLARLAKWVRENAKGELVPAPPPVSVVKSILATPDPGLPVLMGIVNTPVFGRNGQLLTSPGYHPDARLLYQPTPGFTLADIPERPCPDQIAAARALICEDFLGDFPFVSAAEMAHCVALLLLGFVRAMIDGSTPLHLIEKPTPGTGATLMVDSIATILTGTGASVMTEGRDDEEWRKRVTAKLRQVPSILLIDNLRNKLDSAAVAAALTAPYWEDRILGASEMARLPIRCVWIATGNNPEFSNEMARRLVRIRLDAHVERPWQRAEFRHPDLMTWVRANRARLVAACLTLCQAWIAAGRPRGHKTIGSYENWGGVIGGILETAGIPGFLGNLEEMMAASDAEGAAWSAFISAWWDRFGTAEVAAGDLVDIANACDPRVPVGRAGKPIDAAELGRGMSRMRDRIFDLESGKVQMKLSRMLRRSQRWILILGPEGGHRHNFATDDTSHSSHHNPGVCEVCEEGCEVQNVAPHTSKSLSEIDKKASCEECEVNPNTHTRVHARMHVKEGPENTSHSSHSSPEPIKSEGYRCEDAGEAVLGTSPTSPARRKLAPWVLDPEPPPPPKDAPRKKLPRSPVLKDIELPSWLAEIME